MKHIFLISPVRDVDPVTLDRVRDYVDRLEKKGVRVHWPYRDTDQKDTSGFWICAENRVAIRDCSEVHVWWSDSSEGSRFDLGMAFAFLKPLKIANPEDMPPQTHYKSFRNVIDGWQSLSHLL